MRLIEWLRRGLVMGCILYILSETYLVPNFNQYINMIKVLNHRSIFYHTFTDRDVTRARARGGLGTGHACARARPQDTLGTHRTHVSSHKHVLRSGHAKDTCPYHLSDFALSSPMHVGSPSHVPRYSFVSDSFEVRTRLVRSSRSCTTRTAACLHQ